MGCKWYLAMTGAEFLRAGSSQPMAWMAGRFSASHAGLDNLPGQLPAGSIFIVDDHVPFADHDPGNIAEDAARAARDCSGILLDFQRQWDATAVVEQIIARAPCPVAVSSLHARDMDCAVFLCPNLNIPLDRAIAPWQGREVWLDVPAQMQVFTVGPEGCQVSALQSPHGDFPHRGHFCRYRIEKSPDAVVFSLYRSPDMLPDILQEAGALGITRAVGLEQEYQKEITLDW